MTGFLRNSSTVSKIRFGATVITQKRRCPSQSGNA
jgi:hypothetical protein